MDKISLKNFTADLTAASREQEERRRQEEAAALWDAQMAFECQPACIALLLNTARLAARFDDFPDRIELRQDTGYMSGLTLVRMPSGMWRIGGEAIRSFDAAQSFGRDRVGRATAVEKSLRAMGIPHSGEATRRLDEVCRWSADPDEFAAQLGQAFRHLPEHVITASLGLGSRVAELVGVEPWPGLFGTWIDVAKASGVDLDAAPHPGGRAALFSLAGNGDVAAIEAMAAAGASVRVRSQDGDEPVGEAVGSGRIDAYRRLVELGADLAFVNAKGETLLHRAAERVKVDTYAETFLSLARELLAAGVDPAQKNEHGNTAGWYIASYCHDREDTDHAFDEVEQGEIETLAMEIEESGWRARP